MSFHRPAAEMHIHRVEGARAWAGTDAVAVEEPLEIVLHYGPAEARHARAIAITMRTPGTDADLAVGFLYAEALLATPADLAAVLPDAEEANRIHVHLAEGLSVDLDRLERHFYTTSSCGICGKASLEAVRFQSCPSLPAEGPSFSRDVIHRLPQRLREAQTVFASTGGLHAAALFNLDGSLRAVCEDVGRHNAADKLFGRCFRAGQLPLHDAIMLVSGRASFELVQKALMAGVPVMAAVSAPSSLAVRLARAFGQTLLGFVREERFNVYSGAWRLPGLEAADAATEAAPDCLHTE